MWRCTIVQCRAQNGETDYRCRACNNSVKPYLLQPAESDSPPSPSGSPTYVVPQRGELGEGRGSQSVSDVSHPPARSAMIEMSPFSPPPDPWGGARPKGHLTGRGVRGNLRSPPEDRQPLVSSRVPFVEEDGSPPRTRRHDGTQVPHDHYSLSFPDTECRLILIGRTGNGKSSAGNTILGMKHFKEGGGFSSETTLCQIHRAKRFGIEVEVVDTPGFFDTNTPEDHLIKHIRSCIGMVSPGPHALALVIGGRFTNEQVETVEQVRAMFGPKVMGHMLVIFTMGDMLSRGQGEGRCEDVIKEKVDSAPIGLKKLVKEELKNRYVVFNNVGSLHEKERQVRDLLVMVRDVVNQNQSQPFTCGLLEDCENAVQNYEARVLALLNTSNTITRQQVRRVFQKLMEKEENTTEFLGKLLDNQEAAANVRQDLEDTTELMATHIRQHKVKTDELMAQLHRRTCVIL